MSSQHLVLVYGTVVLSAACLASGCGESSRTAGASTHGSAADGSVPAATDAGSSHNTSSGGRPAGASGSSSRSETDAGTRGNAGTSSAGSGPGNRGQAGSQSGSAGNGGSGVDTPADAGTAARSVSFTTRTLSPDHYAEGAAIDDINGDGVLDLIAGPRWYAGPAFELGGTLVADPPKLTMDEYGLFFLTFTGDLNGDGRIDVIGIGDAGGGNGSGTPNTYWYENPGPDKLAAPWPKHALFNTLVSNESPVFQNLVGDEASELVFMTDGKLGYAASTSTTAPWSFTAISGDTNFGTPYVHGLGVGDVDGDGLFDIVERSGYWRQTAAPPWERHAFDFWLGSTAQRASNWGGAQMAVYDVDGDGDADVVSALAAHQYGLAWFEQRPNQQPEFVAHEILPPMTTADNVSQLHALVSADINGDGLPDIVTGKRYYAHPSRSPDPGTTDPPKLLWFELKRDGMGAHFEPHVIHENSGVGCSFAVRDVNGDGKPDVFTTNKHGTFLHLQQ